jgi:beta-glucosidase-like glycosyl hydrolase
MTAHICIPAFEQIPHVPTSLSRTLVTDVLQHTLGFKGLIITDGMGMEAITKYRDAAHAALEAFMAGNDIILACPDIPAAVQLFEEAVNDKRIDIKDLNGRVLKILKVKESIHLNKQPVLSTYNLHEQLHNPYSIELKKRLFQEAITIVKGHEYIPLNMKKSACSNGGITKYVG